jgi:L-alanine-DL-glutamate epimerase-like enolase superfamily enzyme
MSRHRIHRAAVSALRIPFIPELTHSRRHSESVVVKIVDRGGIEGYGEGIPGPHENLADTLRLLHKKILPALEGAELVPDLHELDRLIPEAATGAARCAVELAMIDCALKRSRQSISALLPPVRQKIVYSGVIGAGSAETVALRARQLKLVGLTHIKLKVGTPDDEARVRAVREVLGPDASLRLDAGGAWTLDQASAQIDRLSRYGIAAVEQPIARGDPEQLARLRLRTGARLVADESVINRADGLALISARAVDAFNIRVSKCGGLILAHELARLAVAAGLEVHVGGLVGESAILSAAGRHLAAAVERLAFAEGSFGTLLLTEDLSRAAIRFGTGGEAPLLTGPGLGVQVVEQRLRKHSLAA